MESTSRGIIDHIVEKLFILLIFFFPYSISVRDILIGLTFIFYIINIIRKKRFYIPKTYFNREIVILFILSILSLVKAADIMLGVRAIVSPVFKYIVFFYIAYDLIQIHNIKKYINVFFYGSFSCMLIARFIYYFNGKNYLSGNGAGSWSSFLVFFFLSYIFISDLKIFKKTLAIMGALLSFFIMLNTTSRGAFLGFAGGLIVWGGALMWKRGYSKKVLLSAVIALLIIITVISPYIMPDRMASKFENIKEINSHTSLTTRLLMWKSSTYYILRNPILGVGIGNYQSNYLNYIDNIQPVDVSKASRQHDHPHNMFLYIAVEQGVISLAIFLMILFNSYKLGVINLNKTKIKQFRGNFGWILLPILTVLIIHSMVDSTMRYGHVGYFVILFVVFNLKLKEWGYKLDEN